MRHLDQLGALLSTRAVIWSVAIQIAALVAAIIWS